MELFEFVVAQISWILLVLSPRNFHTQRIMKEMYIYLFIYHKRKSPNLWGEKSRDNSRKLTTAKINDSTITREHY